MRGQSQSVCAEKIQVKRMSGSSSKTQVNNEPLLRNISDTARWVAAYRARESERPDALFKDPFARKLAGDRGEEIARSMPFAEKHAWPYVARTLNFDRIINQQLKEGADMVINLAAGLDARPYRMELPSQLQWVEVDLAPLTDYKEEILAGEQPRCRLTRVRMDLSDRSQRQQLFAELGAKATKVLVLSEGLLIYLTPENVLELGRDLAAQPSFSDWAIDLASPGLLKMLQKNLGALEKAGSPLQFAPAEGPEYFTACGWKPVEVYSMIKTAARIKRLPLSLRFFSWLPESNGKQGGRPWSAVCRLTRM
jgi:methyltransferase (TIGR00027 family)